MSVYCTVNDIARTASRCWIEGLIILPRCFLFSSYFRRLISEVTEWISTKLGHIFTYDCYLKNFVRSPGHLPPTGWGQKHFLGPTLHFDRTYLCKGTWYQQLDKNLSIYTDSPTYPRIWWTLVQKRMRTVDEFLPTPTFSHWETASLTAWTLYNLQQGNFSTCYVVARAYSLEQQNAGRAHAGLCHASSFPKFKEITWLQIPLM